MAGGALKPRPAATGAGIEEYTSGPGLRAAGIHRNVDQRTGLRSVSFARGDGVAGCAGRVGRDAVCNGHLWNGRVFGQQADEGIGNSYCHRRAAQGSVTGGAGTAAQVAGYWFGGGIDPRNSGDAGPGRDRVSGNSPRSAGVGWCRLGDVVAGTASYLDSSATRAVA